MEENLKALCHWLGQTRSPDRAVIRAAEEFLQRQEGAPGWGALILRLVSDSSGAVHLPVRQAGAVLFKNFVKRRWVGVSQDGEEGERCLDPAAGGIAPGDRAQIKAAIVPLAVGNVRLIRSQLQEAVSLIADADFPDDWPDLLPGMLQRAGSDNLDETRAVLEIADGLFKRYRGQFATVKLFDEIKYVLKGFGEAPLLQMFQATCQRIVAASGAADACLRPLFELLELQASIFYSMNCQDIPEFFEDHIAEWMEGFKLLLNFTHPTLLGGDPDDDEKPGVLERTQAQICESVTMYVEKYEDHFGPYLEGFVSDIWSLLMKLGPEPRFDALVASSIRFLTFVAKGVHHAAFSAPETLKTICESVVVPNLRLSEAEEEMFEDNPLEYLRRDLEGADSDTRRGTSFELVQGLCKHYARPVTELLSGYVATLLQQYNASPDKGWKGKDVSIYLVTALAVPHAAHATGAASVSELVDVVDFYRSHVLPELQAGSSSGQGGRQPPNPIMLASCVKFVTLFRNQLTVEDYRSFFPLLLALLSSPVFVVHTYAAASIERLLTVRDRVPTGQRRLRWGREELRPFLGDLLTKLFGILRAGGGVSAGSVENRENEYAMKAVMRLCGVAQADMAAYTSDVIQRLNSILGEVCQNPRVPDFNHYLFETVAALFKFVVAADRSTIPAFEGLLFPPFQSVLQASITEFMPYVFQIMAQMLEAHPPGSIPPAYQALLQPLLFPTMWESSVAGNIPPLCRLLRAFLARDGAGVCKAHLAGLLGVFQKLLASRTNDGEGIGLLLAIVRYGPVDMVEPHFDTVMRLLMMRLQGSKTSRFVRSLLVALSVFVALLGAERTLRAMEALQTGLSAMIVENVWLANVRLVTSQMERKALIVGMSRLLAAPPFMQDPLVRVWGPFVGACVTVAEARSLAAAAATDDGDVDAGASGTGAGEEYSSAFSRLFFARADPIDHFAEVADCRVELATTLHNVSKQHPGRLPALVQEAVPAEHMDAFMQYFAAAGIAAPYLL